MKRPEFLKRVLAGALGFMLVIADVVPAMAAETQPSESVVEAQAVETAEDMQAETEVLETEDSEADAPQAETEGEEKGSSKSETEASQTESAVPEAEADEVQAEVKVENNLRAAEGRAVVPTIANARVQVSGSSIYVYYDRENCDDVRLEVKASNTNSVVYRDYDCYSGNSYYVGYFNDSVTGQSGLASGVTYTFTFTPSGNVYDEDDNEQYVTGTPVSVSWTAPVVGAISGLAIKEETASGFVFTHSAVPADASVYGEYSDSNTFSDKAEHSGSFYGDTLRYDELEAGINYYVRMYMSIGGIKGAYSNVVTVQAPIAEVTGISTEIFDTAITLDISANYGGYTGFQIDKKSGKKYINLTTTAQHRFKDTGLEKDTKYTYRVRAYYYNSDTKKYSYGAYSYKTVQTGAAALNLKVQASGNTAAKLKWKKVPGAAGYEVYRYVGNSYSNTEKEGENYNFSKYELVKSLGKKKTSYTDKKLLAESYEYLVKAYKMVKNKKVYITQAYGSVTLKFSVNSYVDAYKQVQNVKNGNVAVTWYPVAQAQGYLIEKKDSTKGEYVPLKTLGKKATSYTFQASPLGETIEYRIRAYSGRKYSKAAEVDVEGHLAVVAGVKAKATPTGIQVSWNPVAGASYYKVYRTADPTEKYYADTKTYDYHNGQQIQVQAYKPAEVTDNYYYTIGDSTVKMAYDDETAKKMMYKDPYSSYENYYEYRVAGTSVMDYSYAYHSPEYNDQGLAISEKVTEYGPKKDITYYYYVIAYREERNNQTLEWKYAQSYGAGKAAEATIAASTKTVPKISKAKAGKKSVTLTIKKVSGAKKYLIYRSTSKKKGYTLVGSTTKASYKDTKLKSKKTYYYKVKAVSINALGADAESAFSAVKSAKAK